jgi:biopolymer transport protein ExbB
MTRRILVFLFLAIGLLTPSAASAWWNSEWSFRKPITVDIGPQGANITGYSGRALLLVRLHTGNFSFVSAKEDGSDLRFVLADGENETPLKFSIEKFDNLFEVGLVWVELPALDPAKPQTLYLYYGNPDADRVGDAAALYDANQTLVYHFAEPGPLPLDSTAYANNAAQSTALKADAFIGQGLSLPGTAAITVPATPSLNVAAGGTLTWQAWVRLDTPQQNAVLFEKEALAGAIAAGSFTIGVDGVTPYIATDRGFGPFKVPSNAPLTPGSWHHLAVLAGTQVVLYVDGRPTATLPAPLPALNGAAQIGAGFERPRPPPPEPVAVPDPAIAAPPAEPGAAPVAPEAAAPAPAPAPVLPPPPVMNRFVGAIDELRISNIDRGAAAILFAAQMEGAETRVLAFGIDEEKSGFDLGPFGTIFESVTKDGWVVIGLCGLLAALSWVVMVSKSGYVGRADKANRRFHSSFQEMVTNLAALDGDKVAVKLADDKNAQIFRHAPVYRLYHIGAAEIARRAKATADKPGGLILSAEAIAAIRAALDGALVREIQRANRLMVVLTLSIAGGPFLGLLGTVVGVMITFAAVAASGQVNINTIAPGIAGALMATVAGLLVAIPALFGYNYLTSRIRDITADMQVFVDEFTTKMAEMYAK